jgi:uncharacterized protein YdeI (YjbR/CyaY-like superfamily)
MEELTRAALMQPSGLAVFENRDPAKAALYSYQIGEARFPSDYERRFKANKQAWAVFQSRSPWFQRTRMNWVMTAKQSATQLRRLERLIAACAARKDIV